jgi:hypothetical protein
MSRETCPPTFQAFLRELNALAASGVGLVLGAYLQSAVLELRDRRDVGQRVPKHN